MAYRFSNTDKWADEWFVDLSPNEKLMFIYFCDCCDIAGFYELSLRKMSFDLGLDSEGVKSAFKGLEKCYILSIDRKVLFLKNFIKHQKNMPLNPQNNAHIGIIGRFKNYVNRFDEDLYSILNNATNKAPNKPLTRGYGKGKGNGSIELFTNKGVDFESFWLIYDKKVGDKKKCKIKWDHLPVSTQEKIISILPAWNKQYPEKSNKPFPETFLNQERWNDEIILPSAKVLKMAANGFDGHKVKGAESILNNAQDV